MGQDGPLPIIERVLSSTLANLDNARESAFAWVRIRRRFFLLSRLGRDRKEIDAPCILRLDLSLTHSNFGQSRAQRFNRAQGPPPGGLLLLGTPPISTRLHLPPVRPRVSADDPTIPHLELVASEASWSRYRSFLFAASGPAPKVAQIDARRLENGNEQIPLDRLL